MSKAVHGTWVSSAGPDIAAFEREFAEYLHVDSACAVQSGIAAIYLCLRHFGIGAGDVVLVPTLQACNSGGNCAVRVRVVQAYA